MSDYEQLAGLELLVDAVELERGELAVSSDFKRVTTTVRISGGSVVGEGEDVTYEAAHHDGFAPPDLSGKWTLDDLSQRLDSLDLAGYRRWAFESAALDLALRQGNTSLGEAVGREYRPVRFVVSTREDIDRYLAVQPTLEFKIDPMSTWSRALIDELAATGRIRVVDLKGYYRGTAVDQPADPRLGNGEAECLQRGLHRFPLRVENSRLRSDQHRQSQTTTSGLSRYRSNETPVRRSNAST